MLFEGRPKGVELAAGSKRSLFHLEAACYRVARTAVAGNVQTRHAWASEAQRVHIVADVEPLALRCGESQVEIMIEVGRLKEYRHAVGRALLHAEGPVAGSEEEQ